MIRVAACSYEGSLFGWKIGQNESSVEDTPENLMKSDSKLRKSSDSNVELQFGLHISHGAFKTLAISESGKYLAVGGSTERIFLYNMNDNKEIGEIFGHTSTITSLYFYQDTFLISSSEDNTMNVWRVHDRQLLQILGGHKAAVNNFAVHPSGKLAISVSRDHTMKLWNLVQGRCSFTRRLRTVAEYVAWNARGDYYLLATQTDIQLFDVSNNNACKLEIKTKSRINHVAMVTLTSDNVEDANTRIVFISENNTISVYNLEGQSTCSICLTSVGVGRLRSMSTCALPIVESVQENGGIVVVTSNGCMMILNCLALEEGFKEESENAKTESSADQKESLSLDEAVFGKALYAFHQLKSDPRLTAVTAWRVKDKKSNAAAPEELLEYANTMEESKGSDEPDQDEEEDEVKVSDKKKNKRKKVGFQSESSASSKNPKKKKAKK
jgi:protein MAK11